jgi:hypothetical protein
MLKHLAFCLLASLCLAYAPAHAQSTDSLNVKLANVSSRLLTRIQTKTASLDQQLTHQTQNYVRRMTSQEASLNTQISASDSNAAKQLFAGSAQRYGVLSKRLQQDTGSRSMLISGKYQPYTDSLRGALAFLQQNPQLLSKATAATSAIGTFSGSSALGAVSTMSGVSNVSAKAQAQLQKTVSQLQSLQAKMQDAVQLQQYMQQRQAQIQEYLSKYTSLPTGLMNTFNGYKAQAAYYQQQIGAYEDMLNDPGKLFQAALTSLNKVPAFSSFMQRHSALSALMPGGSGPATTDSSKPGQGLPNRDQVLAGLQGQLGKNGPTAESVAQKSTGSAMASVGGVQNNVLNKLSGIADLLNGNGGGGLGGSGSIGGGGAAGGGMGAGNVPLNPEKTKSLLGRLAFGVNLQSTPSSYFFPATTDIGVSLGYKLNEKNRIGIGASYKIGWAGNLSHIQVSSQGASVRSFLDISTGGSWFVSGGLEYNYQPPVYTLHLLRDLANWEPAGLIGLTKELPMKSKFVKSTKLQVFWNFLSYSQIPLTQPFIFRLGYSF